MVKIIKREKKTCYDCRYCIDISAREEYFRGETTGVDYECVLYKVDYSFLEDNDFDYENMAQRCNFFERRLYLKECFVCGKEFYLKQPGWPKWGTSEEGKKLPVCSNNCLKKSTVNREEGETEASCRQE